jgi:hypothetical protein
VANAPPILTGSCRALDASRTGQPKQPRRPQCTSLTTRALLTLSTSCSTRSQRARQMLAAQRLPRSCQGHVPGHNLPERSARARCAGAAAAGRSLGISPAGWRSMQKKQEEEEQSGLGWQAIRLTIERPKAPLSQATNSRKASPASRRWFRQYNWSDDVILAINRLGRSGLGANWRGRRRTTHGKCNKANV